MRFRDFLYNHGLLIFQCSGSMKNSLESVCAVEEKEKGEER